MKFYRAFTERTGTEEVGVEKSPHEPKNEREVRAVAGAREPIQLIIAKGNKHLTKKEIQTRLDTEVAPCADDLSAPVYLTAAEKTRFNRIAAQLNKLGILGETDTETLARYVTAQVQYEKATKEMRKLAKERPKKEDYLDDERGQGAYYVHLDIWMKASESAAKLQDRYFKQAQTAATALGLTISARCKLVAPKVEEAPKENKFAKFGGEARRA